MLASAVRAAAAGHLNRAARCFYLEIARDGVGVFRRPGVHLNPGRDRDAVLVPADDLNAAIHARIHREWTPGGFHAELANLTVPRA